MLHPGLYEQVINNALTRELAEIPEARKAVAPIDKAEASKVLAQYLADVIQKGLDNVLDNGGDISAQIELSNRIVNLIQSTTKEPDFAALGVDERAEQLFALLRKADPRLAVGKTATDIERPETSIAQSSLFTGAVHEPQMFTELKKEIISADRIDMLVSFIKWSGLRLIMDFMKPATVREGVKWLPDKQLDVFFVTLNKADKDYSPTTMYNDYSISESLFHWESQSTTAENSPTGQRYIHHRERGSKVLLFVREFKSGRMTGGAEAYTYLGTASYVKHEGSRPMNITWKLDRPIPAKFLKKTNKLAVG